MNQYRKLFKNTSLLIIGQFSSKLLTYFLVPLYTYVLSTEEYGTYDLVHITATLLIPILTFDIFEACFRFAMDRNADKKQIFSWCALVSLAAFAVGLALYPVIVLVIGSKEYFWMFLLVFMSTILNTFIMQFIKGCEKLTAYSVFGVVHTVVLLALNVIFLLVLDLGLYGYFLAHIIAHFAVVLIAAVYIKFWKYVVAPSKMKLSELKAMLSYSAPLIPNSICWWINNSADKYMLSFFVGNAWVGIYSVSYKVSSALSTLSSLFTSAFSISAIENHDSDEGSAIYSKVYNAFFGVVLSMASVIVLIVHPVARILFQKEFFVAWKSAIVLIIAFVFYAMAGYLGTIYVAAKKTKVIFFSTVVSAVVNITLNLILIPAWGIYGAGIATAISYFLIWLVRVLMVKKIIYFKKNTVVHIISVIIILAQIFVMLYCNNLKYAISALCMLAVVLLNFKNVLELLKKMSK